MKLRYIILLLFNLVFLINGFSQGNSVDYLDQSQLIGKEDGKYIYGNQAYKYEELASVLESHPEALKYYNKTIVKTKWARRTTNLLIGFGVSAGVTFYLASNSEIGNAQFLVFLLSGTLFSVLTVTLVPISIMQHLLRVKYKKKSIRLFNEQEIIENGYNKDASFLQMKLSGNGVGLVYQF